MLKRFMQISGVTRPRLRHKRFKRLIGLIVIESMLFNSIVWADTDKTLRAESVEVPRNFGVIRERFTGEGDALVIHIQDTHTSASAQKYMAQILKHLNGSYNTSLIGIEGASHTINTEKFSRFPDEAVKQKVAQYFLDEGKIDGAEYLCILENGGVNNQPFSLEGIEVASLYRSNLDSFLRSLPYQLELTRFYEAMRNNVNAVKPHLFHQALLEFDSMVCDFRENKTGFIQYCQQLQRVADLEAVEYEQFKDLTALFDAIELETEINFPRVDVERYVAVRRISSQLSQEKSSALLAKEFSFKTDKITAEEYYFYLSYLFKENQLEINEFPNLENYIRYLEAYSKMDQTRTLTESTLLEEKIYDTLIKTKEQKLLHDIARHIELINNFSNLKMTRSDVQLYHQYREKLTLPFIVSYFEKQGRNYDEPLSLNFNVDTIELNLENFEEFYRIAHLREQAMVENSIKLLEKKHKNAIVLIAGGFHSQGITQTLKEKNISYVLVTPNMESEHKKIPYISLLKNFNTPLEQMLLNNISTLKIATWLTSEPLVYPEREQIFSTKMMLLLASTKLYDMYVDVVVKYSDEEQLLIKQQLEKQMQEAINKIISTAGYANILRFEQIELTLDGQIVAQVRLRDTTEPIFVRYHKGAPEDVTEHMSPGIEQNLLEMVRLGDGLTEEFMGSLGYLYATTNYRIVRTAILCDLFSGQKTLDDIHGSLESNMPNEPLSKDEVAAYLNMFARMGLVSQTDDRFSINTQDVVQRDTAFLITALFTDTVDSLLPDTELGIVHTNLMPQEYRTYLEQNNITSIIAEPTLPLDAIQQFVQRMHDGALSAQQPENFLIDLTHNAIAHIFQPAESKGLVVHLMNQPDDGQEEQHQLTANVTIPLGLDKMTVPVHAASENPILQRLIDTYDEIMLGFEAEGLSPAEKSAVLEYLFLHVGITPLPHSDIEYAILQYVGLEDMIEPYYTPRVGTIIFDKQFDTIFSNALFLLLHINPELEINDENGQPRLVNTRLQNELIAALSFVDVASSYAEPGAQIAQRWYDMLAILLEETPKAVQKTKVYNAFKTALKEADQQRKELDRPLTVDEFARIFNTALLSEEIWKTETDRPLLSNLQRRQSILTEAIAHQQPLTFASRTGDIAVSLIIKAQNSDGSFMAVSEDAVVYRINVLSYASSLKEFRYVDCEESVVRFNDPAGFFVEQDLVVEFEPFEADSNRARIRAYQQSRRKWQALLTTPAASAPDRQLDRLIGEATEAPETLLEQFEILKATMSEEIEHEQQQLDSIRIEQESYIERIRAYEEQLTAYNAEIEQLPGTLQTQVARLVNLENELSTRRPAVEQAYEAHRLMVSNYFEAFVLNLITTQLLQTEQAAYEAGESGVVALNQLLARWFNNESLPDMFTMVVQNPAFIKAVDLGRVFTPEITLSLRNRMGEFVDRRALDDIIPADMSDQSLSAFDEQLQRAFGQIIADISTIANLRTSDTDQQRQIDSIVKRIRILTRRPLASATELLRPNARAFRNLNERVHALEVEHTQLQSSFANNMRRISELSALIADSERALAEAREHEEQQDLSALQRAARISNQYGEFINRAFNMLQMHLERGNNRIKIEQEKPRVSINSDNMEAIIYRLAMSAATRAYESRKEEFTNDRSNPETVYACDAALGAYDRIVAQYYEFRENITFNEMQLDADSLTSILEDSAVRHQQKMSQKFSQYTEALALLNTTLSEYQRQDEQFQDMQADKAVAETTHEELQNNLIDTETQLEKLREEYTTSLQNQQALINEYLDHYLLTVLANKLFDKADQSFAAMHEGKGVSAELEVERMLAFWWDWPVLPDHFILNSLQQKPENFNAIILTFLLNKSDVEMMRSDLEDYVDPELLDVILPRDSNISQSAVIRDVKARIAASGDFSAILRLVVGYIDVHYNEAKRQPIRSRIYEISDTNPALSQLRASHERITNLQAQIDELESTQHELIDSLDNTVSTIANLTQRIEALHIEIAQRQSLTMDAGSIENIEQRIRMLSTYQDLYSTATDAVRDAIARKETAIKIGKTEIPLIGENISAIVFGVAYTLSYRLYKRAADGQDNAEIAAAEAVYQLARRGFVQRYKNIVAERTPFAEWSSDANTSFLLYGDDAAGEFTPFNNKTDSYVISTLVNDAIAHVATVDPVLSTLLGNMRIVVSGDLFLPVSGKALAELQKKSAESNTLYIEKSAFAKIVKLLKSPKPHTDRAAVKLMAAVLVANGQEFIPLLNINSPSLKRGDVADFVTALISRIMPDQFTQDSAFRTEVEQAAQNFDTIVFSIRKRDGSVKNSKKVIAELQAAVTDAEVWDRLYQAITLRPVTAENIQTRGRNKASILLGDSYAEWHSLLRLEEQLYLEGIAQERVPELFAQNGAAVLTGPFKNKAIAPSEQYRIFLHRMFGSDIIFNALQATIDGFSSDSTPEAYFDFSKQLNHELAALMDLSQYSFEQQTGAQGTLHYLTTLPSGMQVRLTAEQKKLLETGIAEFTDTLDFYLLPEDGIGMRIMSDDIQRILPIWIYQYDPASRQNSILAQSRLRDNLQLAISTPIQAGTESAVYPNRMLQAEQTESPTQTWLQNRETAVKFRDAVNVIVDAIEKGKSVTLSLSERKAVAAFLLRHSRLTFEWLPFVSGVYNENVPIIMTKRLSERLALVNMPDRSIGFIDDEEALADITAALEWETLSKFDQYAILLYLSQRFEVTGVQDAMGDGIKLISTGTRGSRTSRTASTPRTTAEELYTLYENIRIDLTDNLYSESSIQTLVDWIALIDRSLQQLEAVRGMDELERERERSLFNTMRQKLSDLLDLALTQKGPVSGDNQQQNHILDVLKALGYNVETYADAVQVLKTQIPLVHEKTVLTYTLHHYFTEEQVLAIKKSIDKFEISEQIKILQLLTSKKSLLLLAAGLSFAKLMLPQNTLSKRLSDTIRSLFKSSTLKTTVTFAGIGTVIFAFLALLGLPVEIFHFVILGFGIASVALLGRKSTSSFIGSIMTALFSIIFVKIFGFDIQVAHIFGVIFLSGVGYFAGHRLGEIIDGMPEALYHRLMRSAGDKATLKDYNAISEIIYPLVEPIAQQSDSAQEFFDRFESDFSAAINASITEQQIDERERSDIAQQQQLTADANASSQTIRPASDAYRDALSELNRLNQTNNMPHAQDLFLTSLKEPLLDAIHEILLIRPDAVIEVIYDMLLDAGYIDDLNGSIVFEPVIADLTTLTGIRVYINDKDWTQSGTRQKLSIPVAEFRFESGNRPVSNDEAVAMEREQLAHLILNPMRLGIPHPQLNAVGSAIRIVTALRIEREELVTELRTASEQRRTVLNQRINEINSTLNDMRRELLDYAIATEIELTLGDYIPEYQTQMKNMADSTGIEAVSISQDSLQAWYNQTYATQRTPAEYLINLRILAPYDQRHYSAVDSDGQAYTVRILTRDEMETVEALGSDWHNTSNLAGAFDLIDNAGIAVKQQPLSPSVIAAMNQAFSEIAEIGNPEFSVIHIADITEESDEASIGLERQTGIQIDPELLHERTALTQEFELRFVGVPSSLFLEGKGAEASSFIERLKENDLNSFEESAAQLEVMDSLSIDSLKAVGVLIVELINAWNSGLREGYVIEELFEKQNEVLTEILDKFKKLEAAGKMAHNIGNKDAWFVLLNDHRFEIDHTAFKYPALAAQKMNGYSVSAHLVVAKHVYSVTIQIPKSPHGSEMTAQFEMPLSHAISMLEQFVHFANTALLNVIRTPDGNSLANFDEWIRQRVQALHELSAVDMVGSGFARTNLAGALKSIGRENTVEVNMPLLVKIRQRAYRLKQTAVTPVKVHEINGVQIFAQLLEEPDLPQGISAYHFIDDDDDLVILTQPDISPTELPEVIFHEYFEANWLSRLAYALSGFIPHNNIIRLAHIVAAAEEVLMFGSEGLTPYHQRQLTFLSIDELQSLLDENRSFQNNVVSITLGTDKALRVEDYERRFREHVAQLLKEYTAAAALVMFMDGEEERAANILRGVDPIPEMSAEFAIQIYSLMDQYQKAPDGAALSDALSGLTTALGADAQSILREYFTNATYVEFFVLPDTIFAVLSTQYPMQYLDWINQQVDLRTNELAIAFPENVIPLTSINTQIKEIKEAIGNGTLSDDNVTAFLNDVDFNNRAHVYAAVSILKQKYHNDRSLPARKALLSLMEQFIDRAKYVIIANMIAREHARPLSDSIVDNTMMLIDEHGIPSIDFTDIVNIVIRDQNSAVITMLALALLNIFDETQVSGQEIERVEDKIRADIRKFHAPTDLLEERRLAQEDSDGVGASAEIKLASPHTPRMPDEPQPQLSPGFYTRERVNNVFKVFIGDNVDDMMMYLDVYKIARLTLPDPAMIYNNEFIRWIFEDDTSPRAVYFRAKHWSDKYGMTLSQSVSLLDVLETTGCIPGVSEKTDVVMLDIDSFGLSSRPVGGNNEVRKTLLTYLNGLVEEYRKLGRAVHIAVFSEKINTVARMRAVLGSELSFFLNKKGHLILPKPLIDELTASKLSDPEEKRLSLFFSISYGFNLNRANLKVFSNSSDIMDAAQKFGAVLANRNGTVFEAIQVFANLHPQASANLLESAFGKTLSEVIAQEGFGYLSVAGEEWSLPKRQVEPVPLKQIKQQHLIDDAA